MAMEAHAGPRILVPEDFASPTDPASKGKIAGRPFALSLSKVAQWKVGKEALNHKAVDAADVRIDDISADSASPFPLTAAKWIYSTYQAAKLVHC